jgi:hypothetical protein
MKPAVEIYERVLAETHAFYCSNHTSFRDRGYHVMYGPLLERPPLLFVGFQPGGDQRDHGLVERPACADLPVESYYATDDWKLAIVMRRLWGRELLASSTGLNAIFFRAPRIGTYESEVPKSVRDQAVAFCIPRVVQLVEAMQPELVVAIGFRSLELFGSVEPELVSPKGRVLVKRGMIGRHPALGTLHLSGAQISTADLEQIGSLVRTRLSGASA